MKKAIIFTYGVVAYLAFFASFTYLMFFLFEVLVPKGVNSGIADASTEAILINLSFIVLFGVQHTIMARPAFKEWWTQIIPKEAERSTFVLITSLILGLLFWQWRPMPQVIWSTDSTILSVLLYAGCGVGFGIVFYASFLINHFDLFGLRQVYLQLKGTDYTHPDLKVVSLYRLVRHPLMVGMLLAFWCTPNMTLGRLLFAGGFTAYILIGTKIEEKTLVDELGDQYLSYMETTPGLIPTFRPGPAIVGKGASQPVVSS